MKAKNYLSLLVLLFAVALLSYDLPAGWLKAGSEPDEYDMGTDLKAGENGVNAATIKSVHKKIKGFGTLMQDIAPDNYKGKRIRLSANIKAEDVEDWAGLWMRVDGPKFRNSEGKEVKKILSFDNMGNRPIQGTASWTKCEIVLDVPDSATNIAYGALLYGTGQIWFDNLKFDIVGDDVSTTSPKLKTPTNLDFEK